MSSTYTFTFNRTHTATFAADAMRNVLRDLLVAVGLDPLSLIINAGLATRFICARRYDHAIEQLHKVLEMEPKFAVAHEYLGECYEQKTMYEEAVEEYLREKTAEASAQEETMACGCPSTQIQAFAPTGSGVGAKESLSQDSQESTLAHWPVQIKLVPPTASFLKGADLLVAADCTPVAYPNFHRDFLKGKAVMVGCPKFDDASEYVEKFADIFRAARIKSVTVAVMEVPCCQGLPMIVQKGMEKSGKKIPMEKVVISPRGDLLSREKLAA